MLEILKNTLKPTSVQNFLRIKVYNALALAVILYGNEFLTLVKRIKNTTDIF
jgi:hypothetical protein